MLSATNLLDKLSEWHDRMEQQYQNADAQGDIGATVATARAGLVAIESFARLGPMADLEERLQAMAQAIEAAKRPAIPQPRNGMFHAEDADVFGPLFK